jgi:hypothetical protein
MSPGECLECYMDLQRMEMLATLHKRDGLYGQTFILKYSCAMGSKELGHQISDGHAPRSVPANWTHKKVGIFQECHSWCCFRFHFPAHMHGDASVLQLHGLSQWVRVTISELCSAITSYSAVPFFTSKSSRGYLDILEPISLGWVIYYNLHKYSSFSITIGSLPLMILWWSRF